MTGAELRAKREALGLSHSEVARHVGLDGFGYRLISDYESGRWSVPKYISEWVEAQPVPDCAWCGTSPVRMVFDNQPLCAACVDKWVTGERA